MICDAPRQSMRSRTTRFIITAGGTGRQTDRVIAILLLLPRVMNRRAMSDANVQLSMAMACPATKVTSRMSILT